MKKSLLLLGVTSLLQYNVQAQTPSISNGSFETWSAPSGSLSLEAPNNWSGSDKVLNDMSMLLMMAGYDVTPQKQITKLTNPTLATDGTTLTECKTVDVGEELGFLPGVLANGQIEVNGAALMAWMDSGEGDITSIFDIKNASPMFGKRVDSVVVDATSYGEAGLNGVMVINAMKNIGGENVVIGTGTVEINNETPMASSLSEYTAHVNYSSELGESVDTLVILFVSSSVSGSEPDTDGGENFLVFDNVRLFTSTPTSIVSIPQAHLGINAYPNPAREYITFKNNNNGNFVINVYSIHGQIMEQSQLKTGENTINISQYSSGTYFYEVIDTDRSLKQSGQFIK